MKKCKMCMISWCLVVLLAIQSLFPMSVNAANPQTPENDVYNEFVESVDMTESEDEESIDATESEEEESVDVTESEDEESVDVTESEDEESVDVTESEEEESVDATESEEEEVIISESEILAEGNEFDADSEEDFVIEDGCLVSYKGEGGNVTIPDGVTVIGTNAFSGNTGLTGIVFPESLQEIQSGAFKDCTGMEEFDLVFSGNISNIAEKAFENAKVKSITWDVPVSAAQSNAMKGVVNVSGQYYYTAKASDGATTNMSGTVNTSAEKIELVFQEGFVGALDEEIASVNSTISDEKKKLTFEGTLRKILQETYSSNCMFEDEDTGLEMIDGALYRVTEESVDPIVLLPKSDLGEDGTFEIAEGVTSVSQGFMDFRLKFQSGLKDYYIKRVVMPDSMDHIKSICEKNNYPFELVLNEGLEKIDRLVTTQTNNEKYDYPGITVFLPPDIDDVEFASSVLGANGYKVNALGRMKTAVLSKDCKEIPKVLDEQYYFIEEVKVDPENPYFKSEGKGIYSKDGSVLHFWSRIISKYEMIEVPEGVKTIAAGAFSNYSHGATSEYQYEYSIELPSTLEEIESGFLNDCGHYVNIIATKCNDDVIIPNYKADHIVVKSISSAFYEMTANLTVGDSVIRANINYITDDGTQKMCAVGSFGISIFDENHKKISTRPMFTKNNDWLIYLPEGNYDVEMNYKTMGYEPYQGKWTASGTAETSVEVCFVQSSVIKLSSEQDIIAYLYDANGNYLETLVEWEGFDYLATSKLSEGEYTVVATLADYPVERLAKLSDYTALGYENGKGICILATTLPDQGSVHLEAEEIIPIDEYNAKICIGDVYATGTWNEELGRKMHVTADFWINDENIEEEEQLTFAVALPESINYVPESVKLEFDGYKIKIEDFNVSGNTLQFNINAGDVLDDYCSEGTISFDITAENAENDIIAVSVLRQDEISLEIAKLPNDFEVIGPDIVSSSTFILYGQGTPDSRVSFTYNNKYYRVGVLSDSTWSVLLEANELSNGDTITLDVMNYGEDFCCEDTHEVTYIEPEDVASEWPNVTEIEYSYYGRSELIGKKIDLETKKGEAVITTKVSDYPFQMRFNLENIASLQELYLCYTDGEGICRNVQLESVKDGIWEFNTIVTTNGLGKEFILRALIETQDGLKEVCIGPYYLKWLIDPSGIVYETFTKNPIKDATVSVYYKDENGKTVKWDAKEYQQLNPQITDAGGNYGWNVPQGEWQVKAEKEGYTTAVSDWMQVPPARFGVNLKLDSTEPAKVVSVELNSGYVCVEFDKYVKVDSLESSMFTLTEGANLIKGSRPSYSKEKYNDEYVTKEYKYQIASSDINPDKEYSLEIAAGVTTYCGVQTENPIIVNNVNVSGPIKELILQDCLILTLGKEYSYSLKAVPMAASNGRKVLCDIEDDTVFGLANTPVCSMSGNATLKLRANKLGTTTMKIRLENTKLTKTVKVLVLPEESSLMELVCESEGISKPTANEPQFPGEEGKDDSLQDSDDDGIADKDVPEDGVIPAGLWCSAVEPQTYTGKAIKPKVRVYDSTTLLTNGKDYTISYKRNVNANNAEDEKTAPVIIIKGKGNYSGSVTKSFVIEGKSIEDADVLAEDIALAYNKKVQKKVPVISWNGKSLKNKKDFTVVYGTENYTDPGEYTVIVNGCGNYSGSRKVKLIIADTSSSVLISKASVSYQKSVSYNNGEPVKLENLVVKYKGSVLNEGTDYIVEYHNNKMVGKATAFIVGKGTYTGSKKITFTIKGTALKGVSVEGINDCVYNGTACKLSPILKMGEKYLFEGFDYTVSYANNTKAGKATVTFTGVGGYTGTIKKTFKIAPYNILADEEGKLGGIPVDGLQISYEKGGNKPEVQLTFGNVALVSGKDYTVSYKNNSKITADGTTKVPTITIKGKGNFTGSKVITFKVTKRNLTESGKAVSMVLQDMAYNAKGGKYMTKVVLMDVNGKQLKAGTDYEKNILYTLEDGTVLDGKSVPEVGTVIKVKVTGKGNYEGTLEGSYVIRTASFSKASIKIASKEYTGKAVTLTEVDIQQVKIGKTTLVYGEDYEIVEDSYKNNVNKGTASVTIKGKGNYAGTKTVNFKITSKPFAWFLSLFGN